MPEGARIGDRYVLAERLGAGGMGVVYRALDERLGRDVAVKLLPAERVGDATACARMLREARAAAALRHPGVVQVYDVGELDGTMFLVMELVHGESLRTILQREVLAPRRVLRVLQEVAETLDAAHAAGFVHRDVKPDNIMIREDGRVVVLDFGLARPLATHVGGPTGPQLTDDGAIVGTPAYLSPEQAHARELTGRTDQFALAVLAFELLVGQLPWSGSTPTAMLAAMLTEPPPPARTLRPSLPEGIDAVFARALDHDPDRRFPTVSAFVAALTALPFAPDPATPVRTDRDVLAAMPTLDASIPPPRTSDRARPRADAKPAWHRASAAPIAALALAITLVGVGIYSQPSVPAAPAGTLTLGAESVIACPMLEVGGVAEPSAWLGAAAGSSLCNVLRWRLGGNAHHTLAPAQLLGLSTHVLDDASVDPYQEPNARAATLTAARVRAEAYLDGRIERSSEGVHLVVRLVGPDGTILESAEATERNLVLASSAVLGQFESLPVAGTLDPGVARWLGYRDVAEATEVERLRIAAQVGDLDVAECARFDELRVVIGNNWGDLYGACATQSPDLRDFPMPALDHGAPERLALTYVARSNVDDALPDQDVERELRAALPAITEPIGRAAILHAVAVARMRLHQYDAANDLLTTAIAADPRLQMLWDDYGDTATRRTLAARSVYAAWFPDDPWAWKSLGYDGGRRESVEWHRRAYFLTSHSALHADTYAVALIDAGRPEEARALAGEMMTGSPLAQTAGTGVLALVDSASGHLARALERLLTELSIVVHARRFGDAIESDLRATETALELAELLGRRHAVADALLAPLLEAPRERLAPWAPRGSITVLELCDAASPELGRRGVAILRELADAHYFARTQDRFAPLLAGVERTLAGDDAGASRELRGLIDDDVATGIVARAMDRAGEPALGDRADHDRLEHARTMHGANGAFLRAARRAAARGDAVVARRYAQAAIDAWSAADAEVPAVAEMRDLVAQLDRATD